MIYRDLIGWLKVEFPQVTWSYSQLFGTDCIATSVRHARIYVKIRKDGGYCIDFDARDLGFGRMVDSLESVKSTIVECIQEVEPKLLADIQPSLL